MAIELGYCRLHVISIQAMMQIFVLAPSPSDGSHTWQVLQAYHARGQVPGPAGEQALEAGAAGLREQAAPAGDLLQREELAAQRTLLREAQQSEHWGDVVLSNPQVIITYYGVARADARWSYKMPSASPPPAVRPVRLLSLPLEGTSSGRCAGGATTTRSPSRGRGLDEGRLGWAGAQPAYAKISHAA
ncbi:hypothetical protein THAOC_06296 [Thalassiosira oceanica]|uniref:Uncharacterized protein n=1 Tax=Thalassiosira oceanica TaxID=159749 RepID=K0T3F2_THAOC|nr:hypothetical protein THAOC_06296 [Thalassiosira oceanica]|eukprot:EJK72195.1 hypothetical protein THAOC_06296 [Thalassiosira oceanica]